MQDIHHDRPNNYTIFGEQVPKLHLKFFRMACILLPRAPWKGGKGGPKKQIHRLLLLRSSWNDNATVYGVKEHDTAVHLTVQLSSFAPRQGAPAAQETTWNNTFRTRLSLPGGEPVLRLPEPRPEGSVHAAPPLAECSPFGALLRGVFQDVDRHGQRRQLPCLDIRIRGGGFRREIRVSNEGHKMKSRRWWAPCLYPRCWCDNHKRLQEKPCDGP